MKLVLTVLHIHPWNRIKQLPFCRTCPPSSNTGKLRHPVAAECETRQHFPAQLSLEIGFWTPSTSSQDNHGTLQQPQLGSDGCTKSQWGIGSRCETIHVGLRWKNQMLFAGFHSWAVSLGQWTFLGKVKKRILWRELADQPYPYPFPPHHHHQHHHHLNGHNTDFYCNQRNGHSPHIILDWHHDNLVGWVLATMADCTVPEVPSGSQRGLVTE